MTNFDLFRLLHLVANKDVHSNWISPTDFSLELQSKNIRLLRNKLGLPEDYEPGTMKAGPSASRMLETDLLPFLVSGVQVSLVAQQANLDNWYYINDFWTSNSFVAEIISQQELGSRINHPTRVASSKYPFAVLVPTGLKVYPSTIQSIYLSYYRKPTTPVFSTSVNETTYELEYDTAGSVELEWSDSCKLELLHMIMQDYGVSSESQPLEGLAQKLIETGK